MANVKFLTGTETNLLKKVNGAYANPIVEGSLYVTAEKVGTEWRSYLYYDTNGERIKVSDFVTKASEDDRNQNIAQTYIKAISMEGTKYASTDGVTLTYTKGDGNTTTILMPVASATTAGTVITGAQTFAGKKTFTGQVVITGGTDAAAATADSGSLLIGPPTGSHIAIDGNEIQAKSDGTTASIIYINNDGGITQFGGNVRPKADNTQDIGTTSARWKEVFAHTFNATTQFKTAGNTFYANKDGNAFLANNLSIVAANTDYNFYNDGTSYLKGKVWNPQGLMSFVQNNMVVDNTIDWNTLVTPGCYKIQMSVWGDATTYHSPNAVRPKLYPYGLLFVVKGSDTDSEARTLQIYFPHSASSSHHVYCRILNNGTWTSWYPIYNGALDLDGGTMWGTINAMNIIPKNDNTYTLGTSTKRWKEIFGYIFTAYTKFQTGSSYLDSNNDLYIARSVGIRVAPDTNYALKVTDNSYFNGHLILADKKFIRRNGYGVSWIQGRDGAILRQTTYTGYNPIISSKTTDGDWSLGPYSNNIMYLTYCTDTNYNAGTNNTTAQFLFKPNGVFGSQYIGVNGENTGYRLYVNGTSYFNGNVTHNGIIYFANGTTYFIDNSAQGNLSHLTIGNGATGMNLGYKLYVNGTSYFTGYSKFKKRIYIIGDESTDRTTRLEFTASDESTRAYIAWNGDKDNTRDSTTNLRIKTEYGDIKLRPGTENVNIKSSLILEGSEPTLKFVTNSNNVIHTFIRVYDDGANGQTYVVKSDRTFYLGSGESAYNLYNTLGEKNTENMFLSSDEDMYFYTNCDNLDNKFGIMLDRNGQFYPLVPNTGSFGLGGYRWNHLYARHLDLSASDTGKAPIIIRGGSDSYREGIRIFGSGSATGWATITMGGDKESGTDANTWSIHTYNQGFYITHNGNNTESATGYLHSTSAGIWKIGPKLRVATNTSDYALNAASFICDSWVRTKGASGWYNETYQGGWYMTDANYIRNYNSKDVLLNSNLYFANGTTYYVNSSAQASLNNVSIGGVDFGYKLYVNGASYFNGDISGVGNIYPLANNSKNLGSSSLKWANVYATTFHGNLNGSADTLDGYHFSDLEARYVNVTGDTMTGPLEVESTITCTDGIYSDGGIYETNEIQTPELRVNHIRPNDKTQITAYSNLYATNLPTSILSAVLTKSAGATYYVVNDPSDTQTLVAGKVIIIQPDSTPSVGSTIYINYNNSGYKKAYDSRNSSLTYYRCRAGWRLCLRYDGSVWRALYTPESNWPLSINKTTSSSKYYFIGNTSTSNASTNTCYSCNSIYFIPSAGTITATYFDGYARALKASQTAPKYDQCLTYFSGQIALGTAAGNAYSGSSNNRNLWSFPAGNADENGSIANVQVLRMSWGSTYWQEIFCNPNRQQLWYRAVTSGTANAWKKIWIEGNAVTGAVWNDYAECRQAETQEAGYVLYETGFDDLKKTTERLQHFAGVSSDTWGFSQGETEKAKTPIAVAGRVLVYTYQDRNNYKPGDCVCAAPGGTVDIMTREEVIEYPDRIVGTVSCVPTYEEWGGGEGADRDPVKVNGRIWIKVK